MAVIFYIPSPLRAFAEGEAKVTLEISGASVAAALQGLWARYPGLRDRIVTERGEVREYVNIFVGNENIRHSGGLATRLTEGCEITIVPSVAGGSRSGKVGSRYLSYSGTNSKGPHRKLGDSASKSV